MVFETIFHRFFFVHLFCERPFGLLVFPVEVRSGGGYTHGTRAAVAGVRFGFLPGGGSAAGVPVLLVYPRSGFCVSSYYMEKTRCRVCVVSYYMEKKPGGVAAGVRFLLKKRTKKRKHENV